MSTTSATSCQGRCDQGEAKLAGYYNHDHTEILTKTIYLARGKRAVGAVE